MHPILYNLLKREVLRERTVKTPLQYEPSDFVIAKAYREMLIMLKRHIKDAVLITIGIFSAAFGLKGFLLPNHFIDGGATGISLLLSTVTGLQLWQFIVLVNLPFILMANYTMGRDFAVKSAIAICLLALVLAAVNFPQVTNDKLLVAVFGGFFLGAGIGFAVRGSAVIDGTEVLAIYLSRKLGMTIGDIIMAINVVIFSTAAYLLSIEVALYSMITYLAASRTLDFVVEGLEEFIGVTIVATNTEEIKNMIIKKMGRGVTVYGGRRGFGKRGHGAESEILFTVITRLEINKLYTELEKIEPTAFVVLQSVRDIKGGLIKKRPLSH